MTLRSLGLSEHVWSLGTRDLGAWQSFVGLHRQAAEGRNQLSRQSASLLDWARVELARRRSLSSQQRKVLVLALRPPLVPAVSILIQMLSRLGFDDVQQFAGPCKEACRGVASFSQGTYL